MRNYILPFLGLFLTGLQASAQKVFSGHFINADNDTIKVSFPAYRHWTYNPQQIRALTADGQELVLSPQNAKSVTIDHYDTYVSRKFSRLTNPIGNMNDYNSLSPVDSVEQLEGFLQLLSQANGVSLYKYNDKKRVNYFLEKEGDTLQELKYKIYLNERRYEIIHDARYRQQLQGAFLDKIRSDDKLFQKLQQLPYKEDQLLAFFNQLAGTTAPKKNPYPSELVVMGGASLNTFKVVSDRYDNMVTRTSYAPGVSPVIGLAYYDYSSRNFGRNFMALHATYYTFRNKGTYRADNTETDIEFKSGLANFGIGVGRKLISTPSLSWHAEAVPTFVYLLNSKVIYSDKGEVSNRSSFSYTVALQTGIQLQNGPGFWLHYNLLPVHTLKMPGVAHRHRSIQMGVSWRLKRNK